MSDPIFRNILVDYSEWLDSEGLVVSDRDGDPRPHDVLAQEFLAQKVLGQWNEFMKSRGRACDCQAHWGTGDPCTCDCGHDPLLPVDHEADSDPDNDGASEAYDPPYPHQLLSDQRLVIGTAISTLEFEVNAHRYRAESIESTLVVLRRSLQQIKDAIERYQQAVES